jgi:recombination protein RecA
MFGNPETTSGGNALKFYASVRLDIRRIAAIKNGTDVSGNRTKIKIVKNKVAPPFKEVEIDIIFGKGIDIVGDIIDLAVSFGLIKKGGAWFTYGENRYQGRDQLHKSIEGDVDTYNKIKKEVLSLMETGEVLVDNSVSEEIV